MALKASRRNYIEVGQSLVRLTFARLYASFLGVGA